jgi:dTDP-4-dehydrorhamnose 3,5-epimerase
VRFLETPIAGAWTVEIEPQGDDRGFFARTWDREEWERRGLDPRLAQCSLSHNAERGTLRGMHFQAPPHEEAKLVRCTRGGVYDVLLDLRPGSPSRGRWHAVELTADNRRQVYVPEGVAHGFLTLADDTELTYQISTAYHPPSARGVRWDDPAAGIAWPFPPRVVGERDRAWPDLDKKEP